MHDVLIHYLEVNFADIAEQLAQARSGPEPTAEQRAASAERLRGLLRQLRRARPAFGRSPQGEEGHQPWGTTAELVAATGVDVEDPDRPVLDRFFALFGQSMARTRAAGRPTSVPQILPADEPPPAEDMGPLSPPPDFPAPRAPSAPAAFQAVLLAAAQLALDLLPVDASRVYTVGEDRRFTLRAGVPVDSLAAPEPNGSFPSTILERALDQNEVFAVEDLAAERLTPVEAAWVESGFRGFAAIALAPPLERPEGVLALFRRSPWRLHRRDAVRLEDLALEAVAALRAQSLAAKVEEVTVLHERTTLAREIHDGLASDLAAVVALFKYYEQRREKDPQDAAQLLPQLRSMTEEVLAGARNILQSLRPKTVSSMGLLASVVKLVDQFGRMHLIEAAANLRGEENGLTPEQKEGIFQVLRESLSNVRKHAQARNVWVSLDLAASPWVLAVRDDGRGFDVSRVAADVKKAGSYGLLGMRERAQLLDGTLEIVSQAGQGTTVTFIGPLDPV